MNMKSLLSGVFCTLPEKAGKLAVPFVLLIVRVGWGLQFFQTGLGKLNNHERTEGFFATLHIPAPGFHAWFVGGLECVGGLMLVAGIASRLISVPLAFSMLVAILTAHREDFLGTVEKPVAALDMIPNFFATPPAPFLLAALVVFAFGPGLFSLDALICRLCKKACCGGGSCSSTK